MTKPKLKVLQLICPTGYYGAERWIIALAKNLGSEVECDLAVTLEPGMKKLKIVEAYEKLGKTVFEVDMKNRFDLGVVFRLRDLLKAGGYDIVHTHGYKSDILGVLSGRLAKVKTLATPHGFENAEDWKLRAYIGLGNWFLRFFDCVAPLSEELCRDVEGFGVQAKNIRYIKNGVDLDEVEEQRENPGGNTVLQNKKVKRVGFIGQMISRKNIFDLLDVYELLAQKHNGVELKLLGDGDQRADLEAYAKKLSSASSIEFLGFRDDRMAWLQSFDLFVMTSTLEGIPRCLMESMAMGIPVAAYNIAGIDQLLTHGETGMLAAHGDKTSLLSYWEKLLFDEQEANRISAAAKDYVMNEFSGKRMASDYTKLYVELIN